MRTTVKVTGLTLAQWDYLQDNLIEHPEVEGPRTCVEFELTPDLGTRYAEMPIILFSGLMSNLEHIALVQAALTPDALPDTETGQDPLPDHSYGYDQNGNVVALDQFGQA